MHTIQPLVIPSCASLTLRLAVLKYRQSRITHPQPLHPETVVYVTSFYGLTLAREPC